ncbi:phage head morphogenesis protein [Acinetobacter sp. ACNIH2]|uniref:phage head morphogenesis protein n=1 Tax=Acinetobacter sp. ACNIH2 TaxID=1758189 RepID=UPI000CDC732B|nr:phage minor head protein [Acinetobacter sp. ACNIH2]AUX87181.1 phage head morphogenesis protein [Acinetobacter sp. ACNIH2]
MDQPTMQAVFGQPPRKAIEYLQQKKVMPSEDWWRVQGNAHNQAFVVAHMTRLDLLEDVRQSLLDAQKNGWDLKRWSEEIEPKMKQRGWWGKQETFVEGGQREVQLGSPYRLKTIYQTNMAQAYEAGRQAVMWDDNPLFPYVRYSAILDNHTRPAHRALHGVVMLKSDPAWRYISPKNGYKCRCTAYEMMDIDVKNLNLQVRSSEGYLKLYDVDVSNGGVAQVARLEFPDLPVFSTDAGWTGSPSALVTQKLMDKAITAEPQIASKLVSQTLKNNKVVQQLNDEVKAWIQNVDPLKPKGEMRTVGVIDSFFLETLKKKKNVELASAAITVHDKGTISHISKERKLHDPEWFENIVSHLSGQHDLYWDVRHEAALLVFDIQEDGLLYKVVLQLNQNIKGKDEDGNKQKIVGNLIRTIVVEQEINLKNSKDYEFLVSKK